MGYTTVSNNSANTVSNNATESKGFKDTWSLKAFANIFVGKPRRETLSLDGGKKVIHGLRFTDDNDNYTFVAFADKLGVVSDADLKDGKEGKNNLCVGKNEKGYYYLYKGSNAKFEVGEEVDW